MVCMVLRVPKEGQRDAAAIYSVSRSARWLDAQFLQTMLLRSPTPVPRATSGGKRSTGTMYASPKTRTIELSPITKMPLSFAPGKYGDQCVQGLVWRLSMLRRYVYPMTDPVRIIRHEAVPGAGFH